MVQKASQLADLLGEPGEVCEGRPVALLEAPDPGVYTRLRLLQLHQDLTAPGTRFPKTAPGIHGREPIGSFPRRSSALASPRHGPLSASFAAMSQVDPLDAPDAALGGYLETHDRPPAFEGWDGQPYTVSIEVERSPNLRAPWIAYLVFPRWAETGLGIVGTWKRPFCGRVGGAKRC